MSWRVEILSEAVAAELAELPLDLRAKFNHIVYLLEAFGPHNVREPYVKPLEGKLWEMRMKGRDGIARAIYIAAQGQRLVVLHAFIKKTQKLPWGALETAIKRAKKGGLL
jgi:phage-related protein